MPQVTSVEIVLTAPILLRAIPTGRQAVSPTVRHALVLLAVLTAVLPAVLGAVHSAAVLPVAVRSVVAVVEVAPSVEVVAVVAAEAVSADVVDS